MTLLYQPSAWLVVGILLLGVATQYVVSYYRSPLRKIPGPWLASISDLDRVWSTAKGTLMLYHLKMHRQYGPIVRLGPNAVSLSDKQHIQRIFPMSGEFRKSDLYEVFDVKPGVSMLFSVRDETEHKAMRKQLGNAFSMSTMRELEPMVDECTAILIQKLVSLVGAGENVDMVKWSMWYAWDVITSITFSNRLGFMEQEKDIDNLIHNNFRRTQYLATVGQIPWLHRYLLGNPLLAPLIARVERTNGIVEWVLQQMQMREGKPARPQGDLLDRLKTERNEGANLMIHVTTNIFAGGETVGITVTAIFYYALRHPEVYSKMQAEVDSAASAGRLSTPVTFAEAQSLPYFQAVIRETLRIHPGVGGQLERIVPPGGIVIDDIELPAGTIVGMDPWVTARDETVYPSPDDFKPERWLNTDPETLRHMERNDLSFGVGTRTCTGKNVALLEISKLVPELLRRFTFELVHPDREWKLYSYFFAWQSGVECRATLRE